METAAVAGSIPFEEINLSSGQPPEQLLAYEIIQFASSKLLNKQMLFLNTTKSSPALAYGDQYEYFSTRIASLLQLECNRSNINPNLIVPVAGVSNGLDLLCTLLCCNLKKKGIAFVEDYTYFLSMSIFQDHNLIIIPIPTDHDGIIIDEFRMLLEQYSNHDSMIPLLLYCIPTFHNPTGRTMSIHRRIQLLDLTKEYSIHVIADEVYQLLGFTDYLPENITSQPKPYSQQKLQMQYPSLASLSSRYTHVISMSSFSKILGPGLRVGWIEFTSMELKNRFDQLGVIKSGSNICHFASYVAATTITCPEDLQNSFHQQAHDLYEICPFRLHLHSIRTILATKYSTLISSLQRYRSEYLSSYGTFYEFEIEGHPSSNQSTPSYHFVGGYFLWIHLPEWIGCDDEKIFMTPSQLLEISRLSPYHLTFMLGTTCQATGQKNQRVRTREAIRLCFAKLEIHELEEGGKGFCQLLRDHQPRDYGT